MAAERSFRHSDLRLAVAGAVVAATSLVAAAPVWSGPVADANVIVDLSVIDGLDAAQPARAPVATGTVGPDTRAVRAGSAVSTSRLHLGALAAMGVTVSRQAGTAGQVETNGAQPYGRLIVDWPPRTAADLRSRSVTPVRPLTRKAAHLLAHVDPAPRNQATSAQDAQPVEVARLFPPPQVLAAAPSHDAPTRNYAPAGTRPPQATLFPPPEPLLMAADLESGSVARQWQPRPTAKPDDAQQVAVLRPAKPAVKPSEKATLRPTPRPEPRAPGLFRTGTDAEKRLQMIYPANGIEIPELLVSRLDSLAREILPNDRLRVQLAAYADGENRSSSKARRMSLSRALAIRSFLIDRGIAAGRIDVRALGNTYGEGEADRVDVVVLDK